MEENAAYPSKHGRLIKSTAQKAVWRNKKAVANSAEKSIIKTIIKSVKFPDNCNYLLKIRN